MLFAIVPFRSLEAGPEFYNSLYAPHNCVGGSEQGCAPGPVEAQYLFKDPSKMNRPVCDVVHDSQNEFGVYVILMSTTFSFVPV